MRIPHDLVTVFRELILITTGSKCGCTDLGRESGRSAYKHYIDQPGDLPVVVHGKPGHEELTVRIMQVNATGICLAFVCKLVFAFSVKAFLFPSGSQVRREYIYTSGGNIL